MFSGDLRQPLQKGHWVAAHRLRTNTLDHAYSLFSDISSSLSYRKWLEHVGHFIHRLDYESGKLSNTQHHRLFETIIHIFIKLSYSCVTHNRRCYEFWLLLPMTLTFICLYMSFTSMLARILVLFTWSPISDTGKRNSTIKTDFSIISQFCFQS